MSLAYFIKTCQQEEKYAHEYVGDCDTRLRSLNFEQLQGLQDVFNNCSANAKSLPWRRANEKLLEKVNVHIVPRRDEAVLNAAKKEEKRRTAFVKMLNKQAKQKEEQRVMELIEANASQAAVKDVKENEYKRQAQEKARMMEQVPIAEERRNRYLRYVFLYCVVFVVLIAVVLTDPLFVGCGIAFVFVTTALMCYKAYRIGVVNQVVVTEDELEEKRIIRREELIQKSLNSLKQTEIAFNNRIAKEREERRAYRAKRREEKRLAAELSLHPPCSTSDAMAYPESDTSLSDMELKEADSEEEFRQDEELVLKKNTIENSNKAMMSVAEPKSSSKRPSDAEAAALQAVISSAGKWDDVKSLVEGDGRVRRSNDNAAVKGDNGSAAAITRLSSPKNKLKNGVSGVIDATEDNDNRVEGESWNVNEIV